MKDFGRESSWETDANTHKRTRTGSQRSTSMVYIEAKYILCIHSAWRAGPEADRPEPSTRALSSHSFKNGHRGNNGVWGGKYRVK